MPIAAMALIGGIVAAPLLVGLVMQLEDWWQRREAERRRT